tara:strand:- start:1 stop:180 length:180 start_codon:yes stop_codon:yes gene_type:complete
MSAPSTKVWSCQRQYNKIRKGIVLFLHKRHDWLMKKYIFSEKEACEEKIGFYLDRLEEL